MARTTHVVVTDDLDGSEGAETVTFGLQGVSYSIDLAGENLQKLEDALAPFIQAASKGSPSRRRGKGSRGGSRSDSAAIREWARANGHDVPDRGRVPSAIREAYEAAQA